MYRIVSVTWGLSRVSGSGENHLFQAPGGHYGLQNGREPLIFLVHPRFGGLRQLSPKLVCPHQAGTQEAGAQGLGFEEWAKLATFLPDAGVWHWERDG